MITISCLCCSVENMLLLAENIFQVLCIVHSMMTLVNGSLKKCNYSEFLLQQTENVIGSGWLEGSRVE